MIAEEFSGTKASDGENMKSRICLLHGLLNCLDGCLESIDCMRAWCMSTLNMPLFDLGLMHVNIPRQALDMCPSSQGVGVVCAVLQGCACQHIIDTAPSSI